MVHQFNDKMQSIASLCAKYEVRRLDLFGSGATDRFEERRSDIDLFVEFAPNTDLGPWLSRYFELKEELERVFGRPVDLVMAGAPRNPRFLRELDRTRRVLYER
ncbi:MAG: nucleotidyltransferase domain-containing protein [Phycisphaerae bacterium]|nr:MAG: hypothetical protein EDS66_17640 [Planctomycetota bacterium]MBE7458030.1 nucleotidyltransferase domain-containing protein [Planctomycetia bacterium]MCL4720312.1 nucleotidyltransferase domain-containing protein [Phycisphaerae bacterium]